MVGNDVHHHEQALGVAGTHKAHEVLLCPEVVVEFVEVSAPVAVVAPVVVVDDGGDPDGIEAHLDDVVEVGGESLVASPAVVSWMGQSLPRSAQAGVVSSFLANRSVSTW